MVRLHLHLHLLGLRVDNDLHPIAPPRIDQPLRGVKKT
jgi:hypothetical protein